MTPLERLLRGGSDGNEQLTAIVATLLLVLLAVEGATLLDLEALLTVHAFVGMLLVPVIALKLTSTGWRMLRYYLRGEEYIRRGPPHVVLRTLVAPVTVVSTVALFATGVSLLVLDRASGPILGLHQASFVVWLVAMTVHVLTRLEALARILRRRLPGLGRRAGLVGASLAAGLVLAMLTLPAADRLQDSITVHVGVDSR